MLRRMLTRLAKIFSAGLRPATYFEVKKQARCNRSCYKNGRMRKSLSALGRPSTADAHSRGHGMAQVALSRAQPSCPHCPPSRSPRARPFTFTSAAGRELGDRAALACRFKPLKKTVAIRSSPRRHSVHATECREGENPSAIVSLRGVNLTKVSRCLRDPQNHRRSGQCM